VHQNVLYKCAKLGAVDYVSMYTRTVLSPTSY